MELPASATLDQVLELADTVIVDGLCEVSYVFYDHRASFLDRQVELTPICNDRRVGAAPGMVADRYVIDFMLEIANREESGSRIVMSAEDAFIGL